MIANLLCFPTLLTFFFFFSCCLNLIAFLLFCVNFLSSSSSCSSSLAFSFSSSFVVFSFFVGFFFAFQSLAAVPLSSLTPPFVCKQRPTVHQALHIALVTAIPHPGSCHLGFIHARSLQTGTKIVSTFVPPTFRCRYMLLAASLQRIYRKLYDRSTGAISLMELGLDMVNRTIVELFPDG